MFLSGGTYYHITYLISANKMSRKGKSVFNCFFLVTYYMLNIKCPTFFLFVLPSYGIGANSPEATNRHKGKWKIGVTQFFFYPCVDWICLFRVNVVFHYVERFSVKKYDWGCLCGSMALWAANGPVFGSLWTFLRKGKRENNCWDKFCAPHLCQ